MKNLELYVHIPFCVRKCDYCDFLSFPADARTQAAYVHALLAELAFYGERMQDYLVTTVYLGGGTPSWLDGQQLFAIARRIRQCFCVAEDAEVSIECNPGTVTAEKLALYRAAGINRLSVGLQSCDNRELKLLGRIHTCEQFLHTYELAENAGFGNVNVDLISGLPFQTAEKFADTLRRVIGLAPHHVSVYTLMIEEGTPFYERYQSDAALQREGLPTRALPCEEEEYRIYKLTQRMLRDAGYGQYEISNYSRPGYACRHNIGYWTRENYLGAGLGAASLIDNVRYVNTADIHMYTELCRQPAWLPPEAFDGCRGRCAEGNWFGSSLHRSAEILSRSAQMSEFMFLGLRMTEGVAAADFERCFGVKAETVYGEVMAELEEKRLLSAAEGRIFLTDRGMDVANYCMARFLL